VAFEPKPGFEQVRVPAWIEQGLTDEVLHQARVRRIQESGLQHETEIPDRQFRKADNWRP
jgi:hypothetical protein